MDKVVMVFKGLYGWENLCVPLSPYPVLLALYPELTPFSR